MRHLFRSASGFYGILVLAAFLCLVIQLRGSLNADTAWINRGANLMLRDGAQLYRDIIEVNPPLIYYLSMPPVWLAQQLALNEAHVFTVWVIALCCAFIVFAQHLLWRMNDSSVGFGIGAAVAALLIVGESFGQRDHLVFVLLLPYVAIVILRLSGESLPDWQSVLAGILAGMALMLKPHYAVLNILVEGCFLLRNRAFKIFRPENLAAAAVLLLGLGQLMLFHPEFVSDIVPLARHAYLPYFHESNEFMFALAGIWAFVIALALLLMRIDGFSAHGIGLLLAALGSVIAMILQYRGFPYQVLPAALFLMVLASHWIFAGARNKLISGGILFVAAIVPWVTLNSLDAYKDKFADAIAEWTPRLQGKKGAVFSVHISFGYPWANENNITLTSRYPSMWYLPFISKTDAQAGKANPRDAAIADRLRRDTVDDLVNGKPDFLILSLMKSEMFPFDYDYVEALKKDPRFDSFLAAYKAGPENRYFRLYQRVE